MRRRVLILAAPALLAQAPAPPDAAPVVAQLRFARDMLCPRCRDDIERSGVNHPARRSMIGRDKLETARDMIVAAPSLPGAVPALRQVLYGIEVLGGQDEEEATAAIDAAILAIRAEGRVATGAPPDPRALMGQLRLVRRFVCPGCVESDWNRGRRARALAELGVAQAMLAAAPGLRQAQRAGERMAAAGQALAAGDDRRADTALAQAIERLRPSLR
ncbi:hypothetical protein J5Y09_17670 [Roseomonas sp. PWR1]|uniref:Cytochrome c domain-containing protein n=1 Tax=Roseomonas nitratireducens TaxID=2820810 RepID=A0ABS4AYD5_9PROT|nr:hypothetical protein [Neoroseomonas nitratireducens]MBP0465761.1 hypothetical protein [Neoroseomonas nitratireducens]